VHYSLDKRTGGHTVESNAAGNQQLTQDGTVGFPALDKRTRLLKLNANEAANQ
jgi:hypothetical protein